MAVNHTPETARLEIEQRARRRCGHMTMRGSNSNETIYARLDCKCWDCPKCGPRKAGRYKHAIRRVAEQLKLNRFLTLTLDPKKLPSGVDPVKHLRDSFSKFRTYLRRKYGERIHYICVLEFQKNGMPHLHILVDRYIPQSWIKSAWSTLGGGEHVDIRQVDLHRVSRYLSKYLTKDLLLDAPARARRVTVSRGITLNPKRAKEHTWERLKTTISHLFSVFRNIARDVVLDNDNQIQSFSVPVRGT